MKIKEGLADIKPVLKLGTYCKNKEESYGQICVGCNKCGRFGNKHKQEKKLELFRKIIRLPLIRKIFGIYTSGDAYKTQMKGRR